jgi:hypothetical protein
MEFLAQPLTDSIFHEKWGAINVCGRAGTSPEPAMRIAMGCFEAPRARRPPDRATAVGPQAFLVVIAP